MRTRRVSQQCYIDTHPLPLPLLPLDKISSREDQRRAVHRNEIAGQANQVVQTSWKRNRLSISIRYRTNSKLEMATVR